MKKSEIGVIHLTSATNSWMLGLKGFFMRCRGISTVVLLPTVIAIILAVIFSTGEPWWWRHNASITLEIIPLIVVVSIILVIVVVGLIMHSRHKEIRNLALSFASHNLTHNARDSICNLMEKTHDKKEYTLADEIINLDVISNDLCTNIQHYLQDLVGDRTIGCAIRIGIENVDSNNEIEYHTIGRSSNLDVGRKKTTEPLKRSEGIPHFLESRGQGILFYDDIELAIKNKAYIETKNDQSYKKEVKSMIVAPINGWNGNSQDLIGLLHITSKTEKIINASYVDVMKYHGDFLAITYASIFSRLQSKIKY